MEQDGHLWRSDEGERCKWHKEMCQEQSDSTLHWIWDDILGCSNNCQLSYGVRNYGNTLQ